MENIKGTQTEKNLQAAFAGESQARNKYTYFASKARKEGFEQIADIFEETAHNEKEHAKIWFKLLNGGEIGTTAENLKAAAEGENYEWTDMYADFAKTAKDRPHCFPNGAKGIENAPKCPAYWCGHTPRQGFLPAHAACFRAVFESLLRCA